jgi:CDP-diacylglycerol--inositol 3-phosphatidyltransferase
MYSTFLAGKASHKDVKDSTNWLFRAYYGNRMFMAYCCVSCEVLYLILFYLAENQTETLADVLSSNLQKITLISFLIGTSLFGWATKQIINVIQMKTAADMCVLYDIDKKHKH